MRELWVVRWRDRATGAEGQSPPFHKKVVDLIVVDMNTQYPDIDHWAAPLNKIDSQVETQESRPY